MNRCRGLDLFLRPGLSHGVGVFAGASPWGRPFPSRFPWTLPMIYGLYLSASGIMTSAYRQDVIANNLANSETIGFKRDLAIFQERRTALRESGVAGQYSDPVLEKIGGGILSAPTLVDSHQGDLENTGNPLDIGIQGEGFFSVVNAKGEKHLTRNGSFMVDRNGDLILSTEQGQHVTDSSGKPIHFDQPGRVEIDKSGNVTLDGKPVAVIGLVDVASHDKFIKEGSTLLTYPDAGQTHPASGVMLSGFQERANVDPTSELAQLMDAQRQLEANANMIKYQDSTLQRLVNDVGKIA